MPDPVRGYNVPVEYAVTEFPVNVAFKLNTVGVVLKTCKEVEEKPEPLIYRASLTDAFGEVYNDSEEVPF